MFASEINVAENNAWVIRKITKNKFTEEEKNNLYNYYIQDRDIIVCKVASSNLKDINGVNYYVSPHTYEVNISTNIPHRDCPGGLDISATLHVKIIPTADDFGNWLLRDRITELKSSDFTAFLLQDNNGLKLYLEKIIKSLHDLSLFFAKKEEAIQKSWYGQDSVLPQWLCIENIIWHKAEALPGAAQQNIRDYQNKLEQMKKEMTEKKIFLDFEIEKNKIEETRAQIRKAQLERQTQYEQVLAAAKAKAAEIEEDALRKKILADQEAKIKEMKNKAYISNYRNKQLFKNTIVAACFILLAISLIRGYSYISTYYLPFRLQITLCNAKESTQKLSMQNLRSHIESVYRANGFVCAFADTADGTAIATEEIRVTQKEYADIEQALNDFEKKNPGLFTLTTRNPEFSFSDGKSFCYLKKKRIEMVPETNTTAEIEVIIEGEHRLRNEIKDYFSRHHTKTFKELESTTAKARYTVHVLPIYEQNFRNELANIAKKHNAIIGNGSKIIITAKDTKITPVILNVQGLSLEQLRTVSKIFNVSIANETEVTCKLPKDAITQHMLSAELKQSGIQAVWNDTRSKINFKQMEKSVAVTIIGTRTNAVNALLANCTLTASDSGKHTYTFTYWKDEERKTFLKKLDTEKGLLKISNNPVTYRIAAHIILNVEQLHQTDKLTIADIFNVSFLAENEISCQIERKNVKEKLRDARLKDANISYQWNGNKLVFSKIKVAKQELIAVDKTANLALFKNCTVKSRKDGKIVYAFNYYEQNELTAFLAALDADKELIKTADQPITYQSATTLSLNVEKLNPAEKHIISDIFGVTFLDKNEISVKFVKDVVKSNLRDARLNDAKITYQWNGNKLIFDKIKTKKQLSVVIYGRIESASLETLFSQCTAQRFADRTVYTYTSYEDAECNEFLNKISKEPSLRRRNEQKNTYTVLRYVIWSAPELPQIEKYIKEAAGGTLKGYFTTEKIKEIKSAVQNYTITESENSITISAPEYTYVCRIRIGYDQNYDDMKGAFVNTEIYKVIKLKSPRTNKRTSYTFAELIVRSKSDANTVKGRLYDELTKTDDSFPKRYISVKKEN